MNTYRAVAALASKEGMAVDADIPNKYLKGEIGERRMLFSSVPRLTLMLYEISAARRTARALRKRPRNFRKRH